ncbi:hypothetical protein UB31_02060 [Bradyrhizobium sp. LTSP849]|uniref:hypothetical protein n=1 Tax=Bradyrhizobium sp. LTSP849 TaxID=1615890 RepID=UPI0005D24862|nr:hypothetical protein [Bradyrhizobium sp. LTSP849]KJC55329.1 hypothetical protein UB31_02060 [Bradyrhizobium sp. LTSP849]
MTAGNRATARDAAQRTDRAEQRPIRSRADGPGPMALQSGRGYEAAPQAFVRLTGSHLAKPRVSRNRITE